MPKHIDDIDVTTVPFLAEVGLLAPFDSLALPNDHLLPFGEHQDKRGDLVRYSYT